MSQMRHLFMAAALVTSLSFSAPAQAVIITQERVPGGFLEQTWVPGFGTLRNLQALTLTGSDPAFANPSGDHTVAVLTNTIPDSGGIALACTDPHGAFDYTWEGWFFTGAGDTRRGLVLRADPSKNFQSCYQFVFNQGLFNIVFRRLIDQSPTTLGSWTANTLPGGVPTVNSWHKLKVIAAGSSFRCFVDDFELTTTPIVDATPLLTGWVGVYNFRFDLGNVPVYFDDLTLTGDIPTATRSVSWGQLKQQYAH